MIHPTTVTLSCCACGERRGFDYDALASLDVEDSQDMVNAIEDAGWCQFFSGDQVPVSLCEKCLPGIKDVLDWMV